jgi:uncharacterized protein YyaL (SSP411 family)
MMHEITWQKWDERAFEKAQDEGKPIFLWIDYRGCRACAQMEEESFTRESIVSQLNGHFVAIRVDRDEYPDIDRHYQRVFEVMSGKEGGWPLTLFIDAGKKPLYVSAYVPAEDRDGMLGLEKLLELVHQKHAQDPIAFGEKGEEALRELTPKQSIQATQIDRDALATTLRKQIREVHDVANGGYGGSPRHLHAAMLKAALVLHEAEHEAEPFRSVLTTLDAMLASPIWDSSFYCCTLDEAWQTPQKRKSVAENAMMMSVLLRTADLSGEPRYWEAAFAIGDWALNAMRDPDTRLFYAGEIDAEVDRRIFAAPNAMMTTALLQAAYFNDHSRPDALGALNGLMEKMLTGVQLRHMMEGSDSVTYLVDYATLAEALLAAYDLTKNRHFAATAGEIANAAIRRFYDNGHWGVGDGEWGDPTVFVDTTLPSPAATIVKVLDRLTRTLDSVYDGFVQQTLAVASYQLMRQPVAKAGMAEAVLRMDIEEK